MNINDLNRRNALSFADGLKSDNSALSEVERIKRDFGLSARVPDELRRAKEAIADAIRPANYLAQQMKEVETAISRFGQLDSIAARGSAMVADAEKAIARHNEIFGNAAAGIAARHDQIFGNVDRFAARHNELLGNIGKGCDELLGISGRAQNARDVMTSMTDRYGAQNELAEMRRKQIEDMERAVNVRRERDLIMRPIVADYRPAKVELPNLAKQKIKSIKSEENEKRENLPIGKSLEMSIIAGGMQFRIQGYEAFSAKDRVMVEIKTIDGDASLSIPYDQIIVLYKEVDIIGKHPDTIH